MKLHITEEQGKELSDDQRKVLVDMGLLNSDTEIGEVSIGQMIEFLEDSLTQAVLGAEDSEHCYILRIDPQPELCDALWEAVKKKLNHKLNN